MRFRRATLSVLAGGVVAAMVAACASTVSSTPVTDANAPLAAFYGDSYTLGTGASDPSLRWSTRIAENRGWREFNPSVNGLGFINRRTQFGDGDLPSMIIDKRPDIVFVTMGLNDNFAFPYAADAIEAQIETDLERLRAGLPGARIIVVEPFWYTARQPESFGIIASWVQREALAIGADYIAGAGTWIAGRSGEMASDGLHPNDEGYAVMTERMDAALKQLGL